MQYTFTVCTPTCNRAHTLHRPFDSLRSQTTRDFEWLVIDDGSTDHTRERVARWVREADFPIRYLYQENRGKHVAHNRGILEARGELFLVLDSDDACLPQTLTRFKHHWEQIPASRRARFVGVTGLCASVDGKIVGDKFPADVLDSDFIEIVTRYRVCGEKWGFHRTDVLREFPFPEIPGERFIAEGLVWNRVARKYKTRFVNEAVRIYHESGDSLTANAARIRAESPVGARLYYGEYLAQPLPLRLIVRNLINYIRFSLHGSYGLGSIIVESGRRVFALLLFPLGYAVFLRDVALLRRGRGARR